MTKTLEEIIAKGSDLIAKGNIDEAELLFLSGIDSYKDSSSCYNNLGMIKLLKTEIDESIKYLEKALELDPKILEAYQNLGSCYLYKELPDKAENMYVKALQIDPDNFNTYHNLSTLYIQTQQYSKAKKSLEKILQLDEMNYQAAFMLGTIYLSLKEYYPAMANLLYSLRLKDDFNNAKIALAEAYYKMGRYKVSLKELNSIILSDPTLVTPYVKSAIILIETGRNNEAIPFLENAIKIDSSNTEILEMLAILYEQFLNREKAEELYQEILIIDSMHKSASEALERLSKLPDNLTESLFS